MRRKRLMIGFLIVVIAASLGLWYHRKYQEEEHLISRASAAKVLALVMHSRSECLLTKSETMPDVSDTMSMAPYIKTVVSDGLMVCDGAYFYPMKLLTYEDLRLIADKLNIDKSMLTFDPDKKAADDFVASVCWNDFINLCNEEMQTLEKKKAVLYGTSATMSELDAWQCRTSIGDFYFTGLNMDEYIGKNIEFYVRDNEIAQVLSAEASESSDQIGKVNDLAAAAVKENEAAINGLDDKKNDIANASETLKTETQTVRVALNTDGYGGLIHSSVTVTCDQAFTVYCGGNLQTYSGNDTVTFAPSDECLSDGNIVIASEDTGGKIQILSLNRAQGHPAYRGKIKISKRDRGLLIVNELPLEEYLYGVLPSEMPVSYGLEALKVQAVCARSFVCAALTDDSKYQVYDADVDDSTASQVYQNTGEDPLASQAVDETKGQVLYAGDSIVKTYFFSTSCGVTSDVSDVWGGEGQSYLVPVFQNLGGSSENLSSEESFRSFIDLKDGKDYYEEPYSWFRWSVVLDSEAVAEGFSSVSDGYKSGNISGNVCRITVSKRGQSGIAKELIIDSEGGKASVSGEYSIRKALCVAGKTICCHDGTKVENQTMLPSGYFYIDNLSDGQFEIHGGGFGHGVGMSQNGTAAMCQAGMSYDQVLTHFFEGTEIKEQ